MTESPDIHHSPTLRRLPGTAVVFPDLEHHQRWSSGVLIGLAAGRHRPVDARGGRSPPSCQPRPSCSRGAWAGADAALVLPHPAHRPQPSLKRQKNRQADPPLCSASVAIKISTNTLTPAKAAHRLLMT